MSKGERRQRTTPEPPPVDDRPVVDERTLPVSLDAERAVLGSILIHNDAYIQASAILKAADFFRVAHRKIYESMERLLEIPKGGVDLVTLRGELTAKGQIEDVGGASYISALVDGVPRSTNIAHYATLVRDKSRLRAIIRTADAMMTQAYDGAVTVPEILHSADQALIALQQGREAGTMQSLAGSGARMLERIEFNYAHRGELRGVETGFRTLNDQTTGWIGGDLIILAARPSIGKAQPLHSKILTANGSWVRMGDVKIGQELASIDGRRSCVVGIAPQGRKPIYRVTFIDGRSVEACGDHLWSTYTTRRVVRSEIRTTHQIATLLRMSRYRSRISVPLQMGQFGQSRDWPIHPWLLGVLLGDGTLKGTTPRLSSADASIVDMVKATLPSGVRVVSAGGINYRLSHMPRGSKKANPLTSALKSIGAWGHFAHEKRVPQMYMEGSYDDRLELLQGLTDSDGWAQGAVCFVTTSSGLALDVQALAHSIGAVCAINPTKKHYRHKGELRQGRPAYQLVISHRDPASLFTLERKQKRAHINRRRQRLTIASVELIEEMEAQCIRVSHPDGLYITDGYVVTHNSAFALNTAVAAARSGKRVAVFSLEMKQRQIEARILSALSGVPKTQIDQGFIGEAQWGPLSHAIGEMDHLDIHIDDNYDLGVNDLRASCRRLQSESGLHLVIVDYIQLMSEDQPGRRQSTRSEAVGAISRRLKKLAGELNVSMMVLSQLSRAGDQRTDTRPKLSDLRESGALEQDADLVCFLHRKNHRENGLTNFILEKQRDGPTGTINLMFDRDTQLFTDAGEEPAPTQAEVQQEDEHRKTQAIIRNRSRKRA